MKLHVGAGARSLALLAFAGAVFAIACGGDGQPVVASPTPRSQTPPPAGSLAEAVATAAHLDTDAWVEARSPKVPLTAAIPPSYSAAFSVHDFVTGEGKVHELFISNPAATSRPPLEEGAEPPPGEVALTVQLYPSGPIVAAQESDWSVEDRASFELPAAEEPVELIHYRSSDGRQDVILRGKYQLPDGRVLDVLGRVTDPERSEDIRTLVRIAQSVRIVLTDTLRSDQQFDFAALPVLSQSNWRTYVAPNGTMTFGAPAGWNVTIGATTAISDPSVGGLVDIRKPASAGVSIAPGVTVSGWVEVAISTQPFEVPFALAGFETTVRAVTLPGARDAATDAGPDRISVLQLKGSPPMPRYRGALIFTTPSFRPKSLYLNTVGVVHFDADPMDVATVIAIIESIEVLR